MLPLQLPHLASLGMAAALASLGKPLAAHEVETVTFSDADFLQRSWKNSHPSPLDVTATRKPAADKRRHLQMNVASATAPLGQPGHAALAAHEVETDALSVADFLHSIGHIQKPSQSANTSNEKSTADKRSHLQMNVAAVATATALLGHPRHATLAPHEVETDAPKHLN